jgi:hypothetical protein
MSYKEQNKPSKHPDAIKRADSFCEIISEAIGRLTSKDFLIATIGGILIVAITLTSIYVVGTYNGIY